MPPKYILKVEASNVGDIDFKRLFPTASGKKCILIDVDYVSKWWTKLLAPLMMPEQWRDSSKGDLAQAQSNGVLINDGATHFIGKKFRNLLKKYVVLHEVGLGYHP